MGIKWKPLLKWLLILGLILAVPIYVCTDHFLTWLVKTVQDKKWESAPAVTLNVAGFYRWTLREGRSSETYKTFLLKYPEHARYPEALYNYALTMDEAACRRLETEKPRTPLLVYECNQVRDQAAEVFLYWANTYQAVDPAKADRARKHAHRIQQGF